VALGAISALFIPRLGKARVAEVAELVPELEAA